MSSLDSDAETTPPVKESWKRKLQLIQSQLAAIAPCDLPLNNKLVMLTNVISRNTVFLRKYEDNERYIKYLNDMIECSRTAPTLIEMPRKGDIVLAELDGNYYRAMVARVENDLATVAFLEFGSVEKRTISQMKKFEVRADLKYMKRFIFKAELCDVIGGLKTDKCLAYLYKLLENNEPLKFVQKEATSSSDGVQCELFVHSTNEHVNKMMTTLNNIKPSRIVMQAVSPCSIFEILYSHFLFCFFTHRTFQLDHWMPIPPTRRCF